MSELELKQRLETGFQRGCWPVFYGKEKKLKFVVRLTKDLTEVVPCMDFTYTLTASFH